MRIPDGVALTEDGLTLAPLPRQLPAGASEQLTRTARRITGDDGLTVVASREAWAVDAEGRIERSSC